MNKELSLLKPKPLPVVLQTLQSRKIPFLCRQGNGRTFKLPEAIGRLPYLLKIAMTL
jgi:hypothetical protein